MYISKKIKNVSKKKNYTSIVFALFIFYSFMRYYNCFEKGFWGDEILTFWWSKPRQSPGEVSELLLKAEPVRDYVPFYYYYFLSKFHSLFGYTVFYSKLFSLLFSLLSFIFLFKLASIFLKRNYVIVTILILSINNFLIWLSQDARVASFIFFWQVLNIYFFCKNFILNNNKINNFKLLILFFLNLLIFSFHPMSIIIICSQIFYLLILNFKKINILEFKIVFLIFLSIITSVLLNLNYFLVSLNNSSGISNNYITFTSLLNLNFRTYFTSIFLGLVNLLFFFISLIKLKNFFFKRNIVFFFFSIIFFTYLFIFFSSLMNINVNSARYYSYLVPLVIFLIFYSIQLFKNESMRNILTVFLIVVTIISYIYKRNDPLVKSPDLRTLVNIISTEANVPIFVYSENKLVTNYLELGFIDRFPNNKIYSKARYAEFNKSYKYWLICDPFYTSKKNCSTQGKYFLIDGFHLYLIK